MYKWPKLARNLAVFGLVSSLGTALAQTTLTWWDYYTDGTTNQVMDNYITNYEAAHPDVTIERTSIGFGDLKARIIQAAATNTMPDIVIIDNPDHQAMAAQGALADLTSYISTGAATVSTTMVPGLQRFTTARITACLSAATPLRFTTTSRRLKKPGLPRPKRGMNSARRRRH